MGGAPFGRRSKEPLEFLCRIMDSKLDVTIENGHIQIDTRDISTTSSRFHTSRKRYLPATPRTKDAHQPEQTAAEASKPRLHQHQWEFTETPLRWADISDSTSVTTSEEDDDGAIVKTSTMMTGAGGASNSPEMPPSKPAVCYPTILSALSWHRHKSYLLDREDLDYKSAISSDTKPNRFSGPAFNLNWHL